MDSNLFMLHRRISPPSPAFSEGYELLSSLDSAADTLLSTGEIMKALDCMTQALRIRTNFYGDNSQEVLECVSSILTKTCVACSVLIEGGKLQDCIEFLRNLLLIASNYALSSVAFETCEVYNTLACALRRFSKLKIAKKYALKALSLTKSFKIPAKTVASVYLNLCAVFSLLNYHQKASLYCTQAVQFAQEHLLNLKLENSSETYSQDISILAVAYHNLGVEEEYLQNFESALAWYKKAIKFLEKHSSSSHFQMLDEFRQSYKDAQRTCKKKLQRVDRSLKHEGFFEGSSGSLSRLEARSLGKTMANRSLPQFNKLKPEVPKISEISTLNKGFYRGNSGISQRSSSRNCRFSDLDSDIRELDRLGLLEHEKLSSRRSRMSFRSGELSPIKRNLHIRDQKQKSDVADYQEKVESTQKAEENKRKGEEFKRKAEESKKKTEESFRKRKVIREKPAAVKTERTVLWAVLKLQMMFRIRRLKRWYKEFKQGRLFGLMLKCEKVIHKVKYLVSFTVVKKENSLCVIIKAEPLGPQRIPEPGKYSLYEVCSFLNAWNTVDFEIKKSELLIYTSVESNKVILKKNADRLELIYQGSKQLNNTFVYQITIYNIKDLNVYPSILIDARPLRKSPPITRALIITNKELAAVLNIRAKDLQLHMHKVIDLIIIEGDGEISLSKRTLGSETPAINIATTGSIEFVDKYKKFGNSHKQGAGKKKSEEDKTKAATQIQKKFRGYRDREKIRAAKGVIEKFGLNCNIVMLYKVVLMLQRNFRRWRARKIQKENKAAVVLQSRARGWLVRKNIKSQQAHLSKNQDRLAKAVLAIQSRYRGWKVRKEHQKKRVKKLSIIDAVLVIQKSIKRWLRAKHQKLVRSKKISKIEAILRIQRAIRRWLVSKRSKALKRHKVSVLIAILRIQRAVRRWLAIRRQKTSKLSIFGAAIIIQRGIRKWLQSKKAKKVKPRRVIAKKRMPMDELKAILIIKRFVQGWKARKHFTNIKVATVLIQKNLKGWKARKLFKEKLREQRAAKIIQAYIKRWLEKKRLKKHMESAAIVIQKNFKAVLAQKDYRRLKQIAKDFSSMPGLMLSTVTRIQSVFRGKIERKRLQVLKQVDKRLLLIPAKKMLKYTLLIQRRFRSYMVRKRFLLLVKLLHAKNPKVSVKKMLWAIEKLKRFIKKWRASKSKQKFVVYTTILQKFFRGWHTRKIINAIKNDWGVVLRQGLLLQGAPYIITISESDSQFLIKATQVITLKVVYLRRNGSSIDPEELVLSLSMKNGFLKLGKPRKFITFQFSVLKATRTIGQTKYDLNLFLKPEGYYLEMKSASNQISHKFNFQELSERFSETYHLEDIIDNVFIESSKIKLRSLVILTKVSKIVNDKIYMVSAVEQSEYLLIEVMSSSYNKIRLKVSIDEAVQKTGIVSNKTELSEYIIKECLVIKPNKVYIQYKASHKSLDVAVVKIQSIVRGMFTRSYFNRKDLVLVFRKTIDGIDYQLFCYYTYPNFTVLAVFGMKQLSITFEKKLNNNLIAEYVRKTLMPNLSITNTNPKQLVLLPGKPKPAEPIDKKKSPAPLNFVSSNPNLISPALIHKKIPSESSQKPEPSSKPPNPNIFASSESIKLHKRSARRYQGESVMLNTEPLSPEMTPTATTKHPSKSFSVLKSQEFNRLILKTGAIISGIYLIITMTLKPEGIQVHAMNDSGVIDLEIFIKSKRVSTASEKDLEELCTELLSQLKIVSGIDGKMKLAMIMQQEDEKEEVIYRRSHYISSRYFTITISENYRGVYLTAAENEKNVFNMKLGRRRVGNSQKIQEELSELVRKLKISVVLGQEMLVLS